MAEVFAYCTAPEVRDQIGKSLTTDDAVITEIIKAASTAINDYCHRPDGFVALTTASARTYTGSGGPIQQIDECVEVTLVAVKDAPTDSAYTSWDAADWEAFAGSKRFPNFQPLARGRPYTAIMVAAGGSYDHFTSGMYTTRRGFRPSHTVARGTPTVQITAKWGFAEYVPTPIKQATIVQVARWFKRGGSAWADAMAPSDLGTILYTKAVDPAIALMLDKGRYKRPALG